MKNKNQSNHIQKTNFDFLPSTLLPVMATLALLAAGCGKSKASDIAPLPTNPGPIGGSVWTGDPVCSGSSCPTMSFQDYCLNVQRGVIVFDKTTTTDSAGNTVIKVGTTPICKTYPLPLAIVSGEYELALPNSTVSTYGSFSLDLRAQFQLSLMSNATVSLPVSAGDTLVVGPNVTLGYGNRSGFLDISWSGCDDNVTTKDLATNSSWIGFVNGSGAAIDLRQGSRTQLLSRGILVLSPDSHGKDCSRLETTSMGQIQIERCFKDDYRTVVCPAP